MAESLGSLGANRKPLLNGLREFEAGDKSVQHIDAQLNQLDDSQLTVLARFVEQGGWRGEVGESTLRVLGERISARLGVSKVYAAESEQSPIADVVPEQAAVPVFSSEVGAPEIAVPEAVLSTAAAVNAQVNQPPARPVQPGIRVVDLRTPGRAQQAPQATRLPQAAQIPQAPRAPQPSFAAQPHERRAPLSTPRDSVSRSSSRPPEGRGR